MMKVDPEAQLNATRHERNRPWTFEPIIDTLVDEGRIELRNFGVFEVSSASREKRGTPRTAKPVEVEAKNVVTFQPGKIMEEKVKKEAKVAEVKKKKAPQVRRWTGRGSHGSGRPATLPERPLRSP